MVIEPVSPTLATLVLLSQKVATVTAGNQIIEGVHIWQVEGQMNLDHGKDSEARFARYVEGLSSVIGHADRTGPLCDYCTV